MSLQAYPLCWPDGWKRTAAQQRTYGRFNVKESKYHPNVNQPGSGWTQKITKDVTVADAIGRILEQLAKMGIGRDDVVISTNVPSRLDGLPKSNTAEPTDPGVAVYWRKSDHAPMRCMAIDRYTKVADNLAAIAATLDAMRAIERHGGAEVLDRAFTGFAALPAVATSSWRYHLGFGEKQEVTVEQVESAFRELAKQKHPDTGGNAEEFHMLIEARETAKRELSA